MKVTNCTMVPFEGNKADLSFVNRIRDINIEKLDKLQKEKIEILLKFREASKVVETYRSTINELIQKKLEKYAFAAKKDLAEMESYLETLRSKLREINLNILAEEEKNY